MRVLFALLLSFVAGAALAQDRMPGNLPYLWSKDIGSWGTPEHGGRVEVFASPVDHARKVGAVGVIWYLEKTGGATIAQVRYPALICGAAYFEGLSVEGASQPSPDAIDVVLDMKQLPDAKAAIGPGGKVSVRVENPDRLVAAHVCPQ